LQARRQIVAWIAALAVLSYALTAGPIMLSMAAAHASGSIPQAADGPCPLHAGHAKQHPAGQTPLDDHEHCLFCQGGVVPGLTVTPTVWNAPSIQTTSFVVLWGSPRALPHPDAAYTSRAPPPVM
jgi:hypothetical protein